MADFEPVAGTGPNSPAYLFYQKEMKYRWAFICPGCYARLDNDMGMQAIGERSFNLAGASRGDKAAVVNDSKYQAFLRKEAAKLGVELSPL